MRFESIYGLIIKNIEINLKKNIQRKRKTVIKMSRFAFLISTMCNCASYAIKLNCICSDFPPLIIEPVSFDYFPSTKYCNELKICHAQKGVARNSREALEMG